MATERRARLFRNGANQALRIPRDMELPGKEVVLRKEGDRLVVEPVRRRASLLDRLRALPALTARDAFPDVDEALPPLDDVRL